MGRKQKEKITYVDDGRTVADMSNVSGGWTKSDRNPYAPRATLREQWQTYWTALKMMVKPMLVVVVGLIVIYVVLYILFSVMG